MAVSIYFKFICKSLNRRFEDIGHII